MSAAGLPEVRICADEPALDAALGHAASDSALQVVYFWGPNCPNCEIFARHLPGLLEKLRGVAVRFLKVDAYANPDLGTRFGLHGIPTFLLFKGGKLLGRMTSFESDEFFVAVIRERASSG